MPLGFNFFISSSGFSFVGLLISLGMMSSKGLNKTYEKKHFEDVIPVFKFYNKMKNNIKCTDCCLNLPYINFISVAVHRVHSALPVTRPH